MYDTLAEVLDVFRHSIPAVLLLAIPVFIVISPEKVTCGYDFSAFRIQQYDLHGSSHGSRSALLSLEVRPLRSPVFIRRCIIARVLQLTVDRYKDLINQGVGALLILLPPDMHSLPLDEQKQIEELELELAYLQSPVPVYTAFETPELTDIFSEVMLSSNMDMASSATEALLHSATASGYQMVVTGSQPSSLPEFTAFNIQGKLPGLGIEEQLPTITIVAHYDAFGVAPALSFGSDSNGSGVVALLEMARIFSKLYSNSRTHGRYNLLFVLTAAGKYNFQGAKRWIEDQLDTGTESSLLMDSQFVLCLDSLSRGQALTLHVSKPPKNGSAGELFMQHLTAASERETPPSQFEMSHKKINLGADFLAWEHERFSVRRLAAFTLSHYSSARDTGRHSILDTRASSSAEVLVRNVRVITSALAHLVYGLENTTEILRENLAVNEPLLRSLFNRISSQARSAQLLSKDHPLLELFEQLFRRYLKDAKRSSFKPDKRDPDFMFYSGAEYTMSAYSVKPAVFDLFLAVLIGGYLAAIFGIFQYWDVLLRTFRKIPSFSRKEQLVVNGHAATKVRSKIH